jgi:hypothetical protein
VGADARSALLSELSYKFVSVGDRLRSGFHISDVCHMIYSGQPWQ